MADSADFPKADQPEEQSLLDKIAAVEGEVREEGEKQVTAIRNTGASRTEMVEEEGQRQVQGVRSTGRSRTQMVEEEGQRQAQKVRREASKANGAAGRSEQAAQTAEAMADAAADTVAIYQENLDAQRIFSLSAGGPQYPERVYIYMPYDLHVHYNVDDETWYDALGNPVEPEDDPAPGVQRTIPDLTLDYDETYFIEAGHYFGGGVLTFQGSTATGSAAITEEGGTIEVHAAEEGAGEVTVVVVDERGRTAQQTFAITVGAANTAPVVSEPIPSQSGIIGTSTSIDLGFHFSDPNGDDLSFSATTSNADAASVEVSGSTLNLYFDGEGSATIEVVVSDGEFSENTFFTVTAESANVGPTVSRLISSQSGTAGGSTTIDLSQHFSDPDEDALTYDATTSDAGAVSVGVDGSALTLDFAGAGSATVEVTASDGDLSASTSFDVAVAAANAGPVVESEITSKTLVLGQNAARIPLAGVFSDPDGDQLSIDVQTSDPDVAAVGQSGGDIIMQQQGIGSCVIQVTATDPDGESAQETFDVTVQYAELGEGAAQFTTGGEYLERTFAVANPDDAATYKWQFGDGSTGSGQQVTYTYGQAGTYDVTLTATGPGGDEQTGSGQVEVAPRPDVVGGGPEFPALMSWDARGTQDTERPAIEYHLDGIECDVETSADGTITDVGFTSSGDLKKKSFEGPEGAEIGWHIPPVSANCFQYTGWRNNVNLYSGAEVTPPVEVGVAATDGPAPPLGTQVLSEWAPPDESEPADATARVVTLPAGGVFQFRPPALIDGQGVQCGVPIKKISGSQNTVQFGIGELDAPAQDVPITNEYTRPSAWFEGEISKGQPLKFNVRNTGDSEIVMHWYFGLVDITVAEYPGAPITLNTDSNSGEPPPFRDGPVYNLPTDYPGGASVATILERYYDEETDALVENTMTVTPETDRLNRKNSVGRIITDMLMLEGDLSASEMLSRRGEAVDMTRFVLSGETGSYPEMTLLGDAASPLNIKPSGDSRNGMTVVGAASRFRGSVITLYEHDSKEPQTHTFTNSGEDDHFAPSVSITPDSYILAAYSRHGEDYVRVMRSKEPRSVTSGWDEVLLLQYEVDPEKESYPGNTHTQFVPIAPGVLDAAPDGRIYMIWRHGFLRRNTPGTVPDEETRRGVMIYSDDGGLTWSAQQEFLRGRINYYPRYAVHSDGSFSVIWNDANPGETSNIVCYCRYRPWDNHFVDSQGNDLGEAPLTAEEVEHAYGGPNEDNRTRVLDIQIDAQDRPCALFTQSPLDAEPYGTDKRAKWVRGEGDGSWTLEEIANVGSAPGGTGSQTPGGCLLEPDIAALSAGPQGDHDFIAAKRLGSDSWASEAVITEGDCTRMTRVQGPGAPSAPFEAIYMKGPFEGYADFETYQMVSGAAREVAATL